MTLELTVEGLLVQLADHYTIRGAHDCNHFILASCFEKSMKM